MTQEIHAVTGAFGYTGKYIAKKLLAEGKKVLTLTSRPISESPFGDQVPSYPFNFQAPQKLVQTLRGVDTLYNTYWVRFSYGQKTFQRAVRNTGILFQAASAAGVRRVVHTSITNPSPDSPLPYFSGKARLEKRLEESGLSYAILRPAVIFGREDILINNIAYLLRRFPIFAVPGTGDYRLQPIFVEDFAKLALQQAAGAENTIIDAIGPETFSFNQLLEMLSLVLDRSPLLLHTPPGLAYTASRLLGMFMRDIPLTKDELQGLMEDLLVTESRPAGDTMLTDWAAANAGTLGRQYASELARHYEEPHTPLNREGAYL